ncbi:pentapeptide repeat-containing protein, partial [Streptococcus equi]|nr:pentapeptide repeat-containing protein [Streptococcus equi]
MTSKADLSLSVFTNEHYKSKKYTNSTFRNAMYDDLEINKSYFKNCDFSEGIFKNVHTVSNTKLINCDFSSSIFVNINFFKTLMSKVNYSVTTFDDSQFNTLT